MGAVVNAIVVLICGLIGSFLNTGVPSKVSNSVMYGIALCVLIMGIDGALSGNQMIVMILSIVIGTAIGEVIDFDSKVNNTVYWLENKYSKGNHHQDFSEGFISASLIMCVGSLAIIGSLESGLLGDNTTLFTKSLIDGITAVLLGSSLGIGVAFASIPILLLEGSLTLFAVFLAPLLSPEVITEVIAVGSLLLIALGLNILKITNIKVMNYTPAMIIPIILVPFT